MWTGVENPVWYLSALLLSPLKLKLVFERGKGALFRADLRYWSLIYLCGGWGKTLTLSYTSICKEPQLGAAFLFMLVLTEDKKMPVWLTLELLRGWDYRWSNGERGIPEGRDCKGTPRCLPQRFGVSFCSDMGFPPPLFSPPADPFWLHSLSSAGLPAGGKMFFLLNWHYPKRFFHGVCFGHTLDMGRFASVSFQRLGELGVFAGLSSDKML